MAFPAAAVPTSLTNQPAAANGGKKNGANGAAAAPPPPSEEELTESERSLLAVYKLLKEQTEALRAAKQPQAKGGGGAGAKREAGSLIGKKRERSESPSVAGDSPTHSISSSVTDIPGMGQPSTALGDPPKAAVVGKAPRVAKRPVIRGPSGGGLGGAGLSHAPSPSLMGGEEPFGVPPRATNIRPRVQPAAAPSGGAGPKRPPSGGQGLEGFSIPKRQQPTQQSWVDAPPIPRKPAALEEGEGEKRVVRRPGLEAVAGKSLDRQVYSPEFLVRGAAQEWDTSEAKQPCLVVDLPAFGDPDLDPAAKDTLALELTVPESSARFTINICPGPLDPEQRLSLSPPDILLHVNPRKSYRRGTVTSKTKRAGSWVEDKPKLKPLADLPPVFGASGSTTITLRIRLQPHRVTAFINEHEVCVHDMPPKPIDELPKTLSLHVPNEDVETHLLEHCIIHEVWWGRLDSPPPPRGQGEPQEPAQQPPQQEAAIRGGQPPNKERGGGGGGGGAEGGLGGGGKDFGQLLGALGGGGLLGGAGAGGLFGGGLGAGQGGAAMLPVVSVVQLPECGAAEDVETVKQDLLRLFSSFGQGAREVHFKEGSNRAFVVMASAADQEAACKGLDWTEYAGKKLRLAKSKKASF